MKRYLAYIMTLSTRSMLPDGVTIAGADPGFTKECMRIMASVQRELINGGLEVTTQWPSGVQGQTPSGGSGVNPLKLKAFCQFSYKR